MVASAMNKEQMSAYQRWEMASFDEERPDEKRARAQAQAEENERTITHILQQVRQEAYEAGFQQGYQDGYAQAQVLLADEREQLLAIAGTFSQALAMQDMQVAESVLSLALEVAKAMVKTKLQADPQAILPVILDAMHYLPQVKAPARLVVHPDDAKTIRSHLNDALKEQGWQVLEDPQVERGGCLVETAENQIDASNEMRWKRITQGLSRYDDWHAGVTPSAALTGASDAS